MKKRASGWKTGLGLALGCGLAGCSLGLDFRASQCETNADCVALGATTCDTVAKVCLGGTGGGGAGGAGGAGGSMGGGGAGGTNPDACLAADTGPPLEISSSITDNFTLTCDRDWLLVGQVFVEDGVTLSIEAGTTVLGGINPRGALIVKPGGKLNAIGTADRPIVFTSAAPLAVRQPGDWGGVVILGKASSNNVDSVSSGFEAGLDVRNDNTLVALGGSIFFGNLVFNLAYPEVAGGMDAFADDDGGYDEDAELLAQGNLEVDPALPDPFNGELNGALPPTTLSTNALTPPDDGFFDTTATFSGAFRDAADDWATGNWVVFAEQ
jgi:hypothetical protein